ncbi:MAG: DNA (cytosine-5-)-methyltransferase, partial [Caulobacteraceae bacterium]|nr:DNA (cytosine-5-)-methyltransferase [Caulobacteraceae bacterium]
MYIFALLSVAGLRKGLADPRGNLMLTFLSIADKFRPKWVVWENVPGVLSSNGGRDFGTFLGALGELGYGFAYRVLDAQYFGVAQRRRRVFVVGYLGNWRVAAAVLFERESLQGNTKPSRKKRQEVAANAEGSVGEAGSWWDGSQVAGTLTKQNANGAQRMPDKDNFGAILQPTIIDRAAFNQGENAQYEPRIEASETMSTLVAKGPHAVAQPMAFDWQSGGDMRGMNLQEKTQLQRCQTPAVMHSMAIRRLTPKECERLQGFPDDWTKIPYRNKPADQCP